MSKSPRGGLGRGIESLIRTSTPNPPPAPDAPETPPEPHVWSTATPSGAPADALDEAEPADSANTALPDEPTTPTVPSTDVARPATARVRPTSTSPMDVFWGQPQPSAPARPTPNHSPTGAEFRDLAVDAIHANARQPRAVFDEDALAELAHSVGEFGVLQPIVVRPDADGTGYELVMGERRLRAARAAGLATIPAIVRHTADDAMLRDALLENLHRAQLNPLEEAAAYQQLLEEFGVTHDELATRIGRSRSQVSNTVRLMNLSVPVQRRVAAGVLSAGHARALLGLDDPDAQDDLAARIVAEGLSVRATEELVSLTSKGLLGATRRRPVRRFVAPAADDLAERLSDRFDTTVRVEIGRRKGKVTIEFATVDDLERIVAMMAPDIVPTPQGDPIAGETAASDGG